MGLKVAICGIASAIGGEIGTQCDTDPEIELVVGVDRVAPRPVPEKCAYVKSGPSEGSLPDAFQKYEVELAVYLSPFPTRVR